MSFPCSWRWIALLGAVLTACATSAPSAAEVGEEAESLDPVASWEEARADPSCVVPLCDGDGCAVWRCRDVEEVEDHPVLLAQAPVVELDVVEPMLRTPLVPGPVPNRWWGRPLAVPDGAEPVFEIPWHNWNTREQTALRVLRPPSCIRGPHEPLEKHHIFPQEEVLAEWFKSKGIEIHAFTIRLPRSFHRWLHSGGPSGGQWNEAWRQFRLQNRRAGPAEMWQFAGELMSRFGVNGPLVPYFCD